MTNFKDDDHLHKKATVFLCSNTQSSVKAYWG